MNLDERALSAAEEQLLDALGDLSNSTAFCAAGTCPLVLPGLVVEDIGEIALPISAREARRLIKRAAQAPYGRGEATIVDTDVRRVWQLEPTQFQLENPVWDGLVKDVTKAVKKEFAIKQPVTASLYKLLIYEKGSFFVPHRDTEKAPRMFATLVICLPSRHEGGSLIVSHAGQTRKIEFSGNSSQYDLQYAAFYADCQHEVAPVTAGYRVCLVYNLATSARKKQPSAPEFAASVESATSAVESIFAQDDERDMIVLPLLHQYTEAGLAPDSPDGSSADEAGDEDWDDEWSDEDDHELAAGDGEEDVAGEFGEDWDYEAPDFKKRRHVSGDLANISAAESPIVLEFKGADRARADVLGQVATRANCRAFAALLTQWQSGYPDPSTIDYAPYGGRWGYGYEQDVTTENERAEFEEVFDESMSLKHWHSLNGQPQPFHDLSIEGSDIVSDVPADDRPYQQELHEATGNAGMSMERWYHQAVIVLWPESRHYRVLASQGTRNSVPALVAEVESTSDPSDSNDCKTFAELILEAWHDPSSYRGDRAESPGAKMMQALIAISNSTLARRFFEQVLPLEYRSLEGESLAVLAELGGWKSVEQPVKTLFRGQKPDDYQASLRGLVALFSALAAGGGKLSPTRKAVCKSLLAEVQKMTDRWEKRRPTTSSNPFVGVVEPLTRGICAVGTKNDFNRLLSRIEAKSKHYDLLTVVIPAGRNLACDTRFAESSKLAHAAVKKLRQFCIEQLKQRTAKKPEPPKNWKRSAKIDCDCEDCQELAEFLKDKDARVHRFPRRKDLRYHLHQQIDRFRIDCAHVTERVGRPYTLVCTKNQATYESKRKQYDSECQLLQEFLSG